MEKYIMLLTPGQWAVFVIVGMIIIIFGLILLIGLIYIDKKCVCAYHGCDEMFSDEYEYQQHIETHNKQKSAYNN